MKRFPLILIIFILVPTLAVAQEYLQRSVRDSLTKAIQRITLAEVAGSYAKVESVRVSDSESPTVEVRVSKELAYFPLISNRGICVLAGSTTQWLCSL